MNMIACCKNHLLLVLLMIAFLPLRGEIVIKTFHDVNNNGIQEQSEQLITGLTVTGFDELGNNYPFVDNGAGTFTLEIVPTRLRIQVTGYSGDLMQGVAGPSSVFFASDGDQVSVPVSTGSQLNVGSSTVLIPCYEKGAAPLKDDSPAFVSFPYEASGVAEMFGGTAPDPTVDATINQIGSTWGVGYQPAFQRAFASAILKRHVGLGPERLGGVYLLDYSSGSAVLDQFNLHGINPSLGPPIDLGSLNRNIIDVEVDESEPYALSTIEDRTRRASYDIDAFAKVGQAAFGDIDVSEDGRELWLTNLYQRSLIVLDISNQDIDVTANSLRHYLIDELPGLPSVDYRYRRCINVGGNKNGSGSEPFTDANRIPWEKNRFSAGGSDVYKPFVVSNTMNATDQTTEKQLYQTYRRGSFSYEIPVPVDETYEVILHFAEPNSDYNAGDRIFDVMAEGEMKLANFDIVANAGGAHKATTTSFMVAATGNTLKLDFIAKFGNVTKEALVSGIEIVGQSMMKSGVLRPWGISFHDGRGYLGMIADGSITQSRDHVMAHILSFDPKNISAGFKEELAFPAAYPRERASNAHLSEPQPLRSAEWNPWTPTWENTNISTEGEQKGVFGALLCAYPQPIVSDINFTPDGSMVVTLMDRWAHQIGYQNYTTNVGDRTLISGYASGDILKAFKTEQNTYDLERENSDPGINFRNDDGPSFAGEFFHEDIYIHSVAHHGELITGGSGILPGTEEVLVTVHNPVSTNLFDFGGVFTQGLHVHSTTTGSRLRGYLFVTQFILGKANGLGDIEFAASTHAGEVGNYVWCDANENGIQDPTEFGIPNLTLTLIDKDDAMAPPVQTTTDADGGYIFTGLLPSRCYEIRIDLQDLRALGFSGLTAPVMAGTDSLIDSDGDPNMLPGFAVAMFCTDLNGTNRHDIDFGFGGPSALDASKVECEDMTGCATFTLADIDACVDTSGINQVRYFPTFNDADSLMNEIVAPTITVCDVDTVIYARVNIPNDTTCFSIAMVTLQEITTGGVPVNFNLVICPVPTFDALSFLQSQGFRGDGTTELYSDMFMTMVGNPVPIPSYPYTIYYRDTIDPSGCGVEGAINLDSIPASSVEAGMDVIMCGFECVDLTAIGASFSANGSGATQAVWTTSGSGTFVDDNTFAGARLYCPDTADVIAGSVVLRLQVLDDPCGPMSMDSMTITFETPFPRIVEVPADTIPCPHPFVENQFENDTFPGCFLLVNCTDTIYGTVVDYETRVGDCVDIVKEIIRTHLIRYDKRDIFCKDTIRVQALDPSMFMCPPVRDSVYCHTGYLKDENGNPSPLETGVPMIDSIPIWPQPNSVCDVLVFYEDKNFEGDCPMTIHRTWYVKGTCTEFYETCEQWIMVFDTIGPALEKDLDKKLLADEDDFEGLGPVIFVPTGTHGCEAHTYVPDVMAYDTCSGVKIVKAKVGDLAIVVLEYNEAEDKWESHKNVKIPKTDEPIPVIYEAFDSCHNVTMDTCYFFVKDFTRPVALCNKGVQVSLSDTMVWIPAEVFDEGSSDNCAISLMLARRSDWATACGVNLCDDRELYCYTEHHDSIWCSILETDKNINPVEAHYAKTLQWLCEDNQQCNGFVLGGWWWDLLKYGTLDCPDHPYPVNEEYLKKLFQDPSLVCNFEAYVGDVCEKLGFEYNDNIPEFAAPFFSESDENDFDIVSQIGGGWSKEVPFCCEDACQIVTVELLVMDYWCNWSKCWTDVYVEDKTPAEPVYDLFDISISCNSYQTFYADAVAQAQAGDFTAIDSLLGTYDKVSYDQYRNLPEKTEFTVYDLICDSVLVTKDSLIYDEHFGYQWKTYSYYKAVFDTVHLDRYNGQIADDCGLVCIQEKPWVSVDECGNGFIKRQFKFVGECFIDPTGHVADTLVKHQTIWISSKCDITKSMFYVPKDVITYDCGIQYAEDGSGNVTGAADPAVTGYPEYLLDQDCRSLGIGYYDKVFRIVGGDEACYKIIRTWCFADWCDINDGYDVDSDWWFDPKYDGKYISCIQKIFLVDSIPPVCTIEAPEEIESPSCLHNLRVPVIVADECGVLEYNWRLIGKKDDLILASGQGQLNSEVEDQFTIAVDDLEPGVYEIKVEVTDDCQNETKCVREIEIIQSKKPTAICLTSITAELTPMDTDSDGVVDSAMAVVWANEFDESSDAACGSDQSTLTFLIDFARDGEVTLPDLDATKLDLGCEHVGTHVVNMFVLDESGAWDYCSVILVVQSNMGGCDVSGADGRLSGSFMTEIAKPIDRVDVSIESPNGGVISEALNQNGFYNLILATGTNAYIRPRKNTDFINGVSTRDLIDIQKHILGKKKLDSWYKQQAADANADGKVSPVDLIQLRKLILAKIDQLPDNTSWRFFDPSRSEVFHINSMRPDLTVDFVGVKIGDVNLDNDPSRKASRSSRALVLSLQDEELSAGQTYRIPVHMDKIAGLIGYQFTWQWTSDVSLNSLVWNEEAGLSAENFNLDRLVENWFSSAWFNESDGAREATAKEPLFWLELTAIENVRLSEVMTVTSWKTQAEAYLENEDLGIALKYNLPAAEEMTLFQNAPNPFHRETTVAFYIPEASDVTLTVYDVAGRSIKVVQGYVQKGLHQWPIRLEEGPASGVLYYQIESNRGQAIKKMVRIDP